MADEPIVQDFQSLQTAFQTVKQFGEQVNKLGTTMTNVHNTLQEHCQGDESGVGAVVAGAARDVTGVAGKVFTEGGRVLSEMGSRGKTNGERTQNTDGTVADAFQNIHDENYGTPEPAGQNGAPDPAGPRSSSESGDDADPTLNDGDPNDESVSPDDRIGSDDPVDLVTGEMYLSQTDLALPGVLALVLKRIHVSGYRKGRWFGRSWASTLDQRIEVDEDGIHYAAPDGVVLHYAAPAHPGEQVLPVAGARWPLSYDRTADTYVIEQPEAGYRLAFPPGPTPELCRPLSSIADRNGNRITFVHDDEGFPREVFHSGGYRLAVDNLATSRGLRVEAVHLLDGAGQGTKIVSFGYDAAGRLTDVVNSSGAPLVFAYDDKDRITSWTDRNGLFYEYHFDASGRVTRTEGSGGFLRGEFVFDLAARTTTATDSLGNATVYHWNERNQVVRVVNPLGAETLTEQDRYGRVLSYTDELGNATRYVRDAAGDVVRVERADGTAVAIEYDPVLRLPTTVTRPDGATWRYAYDERGNPVRTVDPLGAATTLAYDEHGALAAATDALGNTSVFSSDAAGLLREMTDALGAVTRVERDGFGRPVAVTDPLGAVTRLGWTVEGRGAWREAPDGVRVEWEYDGEGNVVRCRNENAGATGFEYGPFDKLVGRTDADGTRYAFSYDTQLRLTAVTNPAGQVWRYEYDSADNLVRETDFNDRTLSYSYDAAGRLAERVNGAGESIVFGRDALGRVTERRTGDGVDAFAYSPDGDLLGASGPGGTLTYTRDPLGRVLTETVDGRTLTNEYDALGRRIRRTTPSGAVSVWAYDAVGQPSSLATAAGGLLFEHDAAGRETTRYLGPAAALSQSFDPIGRLTGQAVWAYDQPEAADNGARLVQERGYTYRPDGIPTRITDHLRGTRTFELDPAGRVTAVDAATWRETYAYDRPGNLAHAVDPAAGGGESPGHGHGDGRGDGGATGSRERPPTLIRRVGRASHQHDAQGRVIRTSRKTLSGQTREQTYVWDAQDRLTSTTTPDGTVWRYRYDLLGRRTGKQRLQPDGGTAEHVTFTWDSTRLAEQTGSDAAGTASHTLTWDYEPGGYRPLTQVDTRRSADPDQPEIDRAFHAIVSDLVGTPTELVSAQGTVEWQLQTTLWGAPLPGRVDSAAHCPLRFPGQYADSETGLHYNFHRYYDPETAGYLSPDSLGLAGSDGPHRYADNPLTGMDPLGLAIDCKRAAKLAKSASDRAGRGVRDLAKEIPGATPDDPPKRRGYHGRLTPERELEVMSNPDAVYMSSDRDQRFTFRQGGDIVVTLGADNGNPSRSNHIFTSYGPSGPRGESGAAIFGGSPSDPGMPITHDQIVNGKIAKPEGGFLAPAKQILP